MNFEQVKEAVLSNPFIGKLRGELTIDGEAFDQLCASLESLVPIWRLVNLIDKELMSALYEMPLMIMNQWLSESDHWSETNREELWNMYIKLDNLITECLAPNGNGSGEPTESRPGSVSVYRGD